MGWNILFDSKLCEISKKIFIFFEFLNFQVKVAMINAFLLAWLTHLTTKILADLHSNLYGPDAVMEIFEATPR